MIAIAIFAILSQCVLAEAEPKQLCGEEPLISFCKLQAVRGPCKSEIQRYFYNATSKKCEVFTYGGCRGNVNNFETERDCLDSCSRESNGASLQSGHDVCFLQISEGEGAHSTEQYYYNANERKCLPFMYKGTGGNDNRFSTWQACQARCKRANSGDVCDITKSESPSLTCMAFFKRFRYNKDTSECEEFVFGGCCSTANNFVTKNQCQKICYNR